MWRHQRPCERCLSCGARPAGEEKAQEMGQSLLDGRFIQSVAGHVDDGCTFEASPRTLYRWEIRRGELGVLWWALVFD